MTKGKLVKKKFISSVAAVALGLGGMLAGAASAVADEAPLATVCTPTAAWTQEVPAVGEPTIPNPDFQPEVPGWTETIPAQGEPKITVPNPDYVPGKDAWTETIPAQGEPTVTVDNPEYVPAVPEVPEVSHTDYKYQYFGLLIFPTDRYETFHEYKGDEFRDQYLGFWRLKSTSKHVTQEYVPAKPAVGEPTIQVPNPDYVPGKTIEHPAVEPVGEPTVEVDNPDYIPGKTIEHPTVPAKGEPTIPNPSYVPAKTIQHEAVKCQEDVTLTVTTRCLDGTAHVAVRVNNGTGGTLTVKSGPQSSVTFAASEVAARSNFYQSFNQRTDQLAKGKVVVALRNAGGAWTSSANYTALDCEVTPAPTVTNPPASAPVTPAPSVTQVTKTVVNEANPTETLAAHKGSALASTGANTRAVGIGAGILLLAGVVILAARRFSSN